MTIKHIESIRAKITTLKACYPNNQKIQQKLNDLDLSMYLAETTIKNTGGVGPLNADWAKTLMRDINEEVMKTATYRYIKDIYDTKRHGSYQKKD